MRRTEGSSAPAFELVRLTKQYGSDRPAVDELTLTIPAGEITVIVGPSGCGKTTTLRMLNRMVEPTSGEIRYFGEPIDRQPVTELRRRMGYVIQSGGLFPHRSVASNIATVPRLLGWPAPKVRERVAELVTAVGLDPSLLRRFPGQLSGGQQQRVGVARALAAQPEVLLMDEPFSAVDPVVRGELQDLVRSLQADLGCTIVMITHDIDEAVTLGDQVAILSQGRLRQCAPPRQILSAPANDFVRGFVGRDRGWRALSFRPAAELELAPARAEAGSASTFDPALDSIRVALDAALTSATSTALAVDRATGAVLGEIGLADIIRHLNEHPFTPVAEEG